MKWLSKVKINYFLDRLIDVLSSVIHVLFLQFLYYAFHRLYGYKTELCFLIFFAQVPFTLNTLWNKVYITDDGYVYSSKAGRIIKRACVYCCLLALGVNSVLILNSFNCWFKGKYSWLLLFWSCYDEYTKKRKDKKQSDVFDVFNNNILFFCWQWIIIMI